MTKEYEDIMNKILKIVASGKNAEVKKNKDGKLKVFMVNRKIV